MLGNFKSTHLLFKDEKQIDKRSITGTLRPGSRPIASFQGATFYCHNITSEHHRALK